MQKYTIHIYCATKAFSVNVYSVQTFALSISSNEAAKIHILIFDPLSFKNHLPGEMPVSVIAVVRMNQEL
jgi:hypothetical protein